MRCGWREGRNAGLGTMSQLGAQRRATLQRQGKEGQGLSSGRSGAGGEGGGARGPEAPPSVINTRSVLYNAIAISSQEAAHQEKSSLRGVGLLVGDSDFS